MTIRTALLAAALSTATLAMPAAAQTAVSVKYADLDLSTPAGRDKLDKRIEAAAREACGFNEERTGTRLVSRNSEQCYSETLASVHKQVAETIAKTGRTIG